MSKTIELTAEQVEKLIEALDNDVSYKINESGCADEYKGQITIYLNLMKLLGEDVSGYRESLKAETQQICDNCKSRCPFVDKDGKGNCILKSGSMMSTDTCDEWEAK